MGMTLKIALVLKDAEFYLEPCSHNKSLQLKKRKKYTNINVQVMKIELKTTNIKQFHMQSQIQD